MGRAFHWFMASYLGTLPAGSLWDAIVRAWDWHSQAQVVGLVLPPIPCVTLAKYLPLSGPKSLLNMWDREARWSLNLFQLPIGGRSGLKTINVSRYPQSLDFPLFNVGWLIPADLSRRAARNTLDCPMLSFYMLFSLRRIPFRRQRWPLNSLPASSF